MSANKLIGFIGQGWIGKHYADNFEERGFQVIRYALTEPYIKNEKKIAQCDIVFIAVPTPSTPKGFDDSILRQAIKKVGNGKTAVIKSTILPGTTEHIQKENPDFFVMHSPEFLSEATAAYDAAHPNRNIIGIPMDNEIYRNKAQEVFEVLPNAPFQIICNAREAEMSKYAGNCLFYIKVVFINLLYDVTKNLGLNWDTIKKIIAADPRIGYSHLNPIDSSGANKKIMKGRGAGGHCFIKDFAAFTEIYEKLVGDEKGKKMLQALKEKNLDLLISSEKDLDLIRGVYGDDTINRI